MKFNKRDIGRAIKALPETDTIYSETNTNGEYELVEISETQDKIRVEIIKHKEHTYVGHIFWVRANLFELKEVTQMDEMRRLGYGI